jgi:hypothetical protein
LITVSALLIASKYEEIYPPLLKDYNFITNGKCKVEDILEMEKKILFVLDFDI